MSVSRYLASIGFEFVVVVAVVWKIRSKDFPHNARPFHKISLVKKYQFGTTATTTTTTTTR